MDAKPQKIAVTGATGFLGSHITDRLLRDGHLVSILARDPDKARRFEGRVERIVVADVNDKAAMARLVQGADSILHLVSNFRTASGPPDSYRQINAEGTINALSAAEKAGVRRFIYCSTIGVHGHVKETPADENSPFNPGDLYQETKVEAEAACHRYMENTGMDVVIVRPCSIYGPGDLRMLKMFRMLAKGTFLMLGPCAENFHAVYIDDLVDGFVKVLKQPGIGGETFIIGGNSYLPLNDYIQTAARAVGATGKLRRFPYWPFYAAAVACETICVPFGIEPPLHRRRVRFFKNNRAFSIDKARRVLGYAPRVDLEEGLRRTVAWYRDQGYL